MRHFGFNCTGQLKTRNGGVVMQQRALRRNWTHSHRARPASSVHGECIILSLYSCLLFKPYGETWSTILLTGCCAAWYSLRSNQEIQTYAIALINALFLKAPEDRRQVSAHPGNNSTLSLPSSYCPLNKATHTYSLDTDWNYLQILPHPCCKCWEQWLNSLKLFSWIDVCLPAVMLWILSDT